MSIELTFVVVVYAAILIALAIYGVNFFYLAIVAPRVKRQMSERPLPDRLPTVTVQLPIFNERLVAERVIDAVARLDWPRDRLDIQVLDDSTDATRDLVAHAVARWRSAGVTIQHIHRAHREGYKAGALSAGLARAAGEFIAIFDADFVPAPDFLRRTIGVFADPQVGFVQARWEHLNRHTSLLTHLQSLSIDGHFMVEQMARAGKGYTMNFNGTAGVWRRAAIEDAGGWNPGSLTEDLDLSYRAAMRGWKPAYLPDVAVPAELVSNVSAYLKQQARWAQGSVECACRLLPAVVRSSLSRPAKLEAGLHLTGYFIQILMLMASLLYPILMEMHMPERWHLALFWIGMLVAPTVLAPAVLFLTAQRLLRPRRWWREIPGVLALSVLGAGMVLNSARSFWRGLRAQPAVFERTPKLGLTGSQAHPPGSIYRSRSDWMILMQIFLAGWNVYTAVVAWNVRNLGIFINASIFAVGLFAVATAMVWESRVQWRQHLRQVLRAPLRDLAPEPEPALSLPPLNRRRRS